MPERMTKNDALFLYTDNAIAEMQVAMGCIIDGVVDYDRYHAWVKPRLEQTPRLNQVVKYAPFNVWYPSWVEVEDFDASDHIHHIEMPAPGTVGQLKEMATEQFHKRLDRSRPLWLLFVVTGLEGGKSAILFYVHHAICDGAAAMEIFKSMYDPPEGGWPDHVHLQRAEPKRTKTPPVIVRFFKGLASKETRARLSQLMRYFKAPAPWLPFTRPVSGKCTFAWRHVPLDRLQIIRNAFGGTVTDIGLTALAGAMDRYAARNGIDVADQFFKVMMPENVRAKENYGNMGNEVTVIPTLVPLGIADPVERLRGTVKETRHAKDHKLGRLLHDVLVALMDFIRPLGAAWLTKLLASRGWGNFERRIRKSPREHTIVTSVQMPRTLVNNIDGYEILDSFPLVPCGLSLGIMCALISYRDELHIALTGDAETLPDIDQVMDDMIEEINALHAAASPSALNVPTPFPEAVAK
jgi:diacylglycerol O-acyltransferase / wax synthase